MSGNPSSTLQSCLYEGVVSHCRFLPRRHRFSYQVYMVYLDLAELDQVFHDSWSWSSTSPNLAWFRRADYLGDPTVPLDQAVRARVKEATGHWPQGPVRMLSNLRYFGFIINPITCYYCFDEEDRLQYLVAEVTNTPWRQRHSYVLPCDPDKPVLNTSFDKAMHVSPFMPMDMRYVWRSRRPDQHLSIFMENWGDGRRQFSASIHMKRLALTPASLRRVLWRYPVMTMKVGAAIYWQALKLWWKKIPFVPHPRIKREPCARTIEGDQV